MNDENLTCEHGATEEHPFRKEVSLGIAVSDWCTGPVIVPTPSEPGLYAFEDYAHVVSKNSSEARNAFILAGYDATNGEIRRFADDELFTIQYEEPGDIPAGVQRNDYVCDCNFPEGECECDVLATLPVHDLIELFPVGEVIREFQS